MHLASALCGLVLLVTALAPLGDTGAHRAGMKTFDDLEVRRPELARSYLEPLKAQPGRPIALFAPAASEKPSIWTKI